MVIPLACKSRPIARLFPSTIWISGRFTVGSTTPSTPTVPPVPSTPGLVLPMAAACVVPSIRVPEPVMAGRRLVRLIVNTPVAAL